MQQIVCVSSACWYPFPTRKQNVMSRLTDCEVLYFDPPVTLLAPLKDPKAWKKLFAYRRAQPKPQDNITVYATPPVLPFYNRFRWINRINQRLLARFIRKTCARHGFNRPILWCYLPSSCDLLGKLDVRGVVYDCVDRHSAYGGTMNPALVDEMEKELARRATVVFSTALGLHETLRDYNKNAHLIPNGVNYPLFSQAASPLPSPEDMKDLPRPIYGFVGMLQDCIDYNFIKALADACPESSVVLIGRPLPGVDLSMLDACQNVHRLGLKPYETLPSYIAQFDVCLNLFRPGALSKDVSPLKFYEYLATGKPIVSTPEPLQVQEYGDVVEVAETAEDFIEKCRAAAFEKSDMLKARRMAYGEAASWDARVAAMREILTKSGLGW